jgi:hypothetical protein
VVFHRHCLQRKDLQRRPLAKFATASILQPDEFATAPFEGRFVLGLIALVVAVGMHIVARWGAVLIIRTGREEQEDGSAGDVMVLTQT